MYENTLQELASQLQKPHGEAGKQLGSKMNLTNAGLNSLAIKQLRVQPHDHILEIGMGNGFFVKDIIAAATGVKYTGCDFSATMVAEANRINKDLIENQQAQFFLAAAHQLPLAAASVNKVLAVNTIYFWEQPNRELAEIRRVLKPNGKLLLGLRPQSVMEQYPFTAYGFKLYSAEKLTRLLENNHYKVTGVWEKPEPDQEINGTSVKVVALLVQAVPI